MNKFLSRSINHSTIAFGLFFVLLTFLVITGKSYGHSHNHQAENVSNVSQASEGLFEDKDVKDKLLNNWQGIWQSVYPYLLSGDLDSFLQYKAKKNADKTVEEYKKYYTKGYATDIALIRIKNNTVEFYSADKVASCNYTYSGFKILTYETGKKGVRYLFQCDDDNTKAPKYIQFSDHSIGPTKAEHFHIFMGNVSHDVLLEEMESWPTFYPVSVDKYEIVKELIGHGAQDVDEHDAHEHSAHEHSAHEHSAHEHGVLKLNVIVEDKTVDIEFKGALANFISFEHEPENEAEIKEIKNMAMRMHNAKKLFIFPSQAKCQLNDVLLKSAVIENSLLQQKKSAKLNPEKGASKGNDLEKTHGNLEANIAFTCKSPKNLDKIEVNLFKIFPSLERIEVQMLTPNGQGGALLSPESTIIKW